MKRWILIAALVALADQLSKWAALHWLKPGEVVYVTRFFNWVLFFNEGASFSFLSNAGGWQRWFFTALALVVSVWIVFQLRAYHTQRCLSLGFSLILGGAIGNVIDRIELGAVVDFVQWHVAGHYWPAFNVADSAIVLGVVLIFWDWFFIKKNTAT